MILPIIIASSVDSIGMVYKTNIFVLDESHKTSIDLDSYRYNAYMQFEQKLGRFNLNSGIRTSYWTLNEEYLFSPRASLSYQPFWDKDIVFRFATGYYQTPFYRELRDFNGNLNTNIKSQNPFIMYWVVTIILKFGNVLLS